MLIAHTEPLFKSQKILKLVDMHTFQIALIVSKYNHGLWRGNFNPEHASSVHSHNTRYAKEKNFFIPPASNNIYKRSLSFLGPSVWKDVPETLKSLHSDAFKQQFKVHLLNSYVMFMITISSQYA